MRSSFAVANSAANDERPIFLFGVGRCGSTFLQLQLCRTDDVWIWGEHDGVLRNIFDWSSQSRNLEQLSSYSLDAPEPNFLDFVSEPFSGNPTHLAWMNGFKRHDLENVERQVVSYLLTRNLPEGKRRWGFKEIRYGFDDAVPERLIELFPSAKLVHTVRHPRRNIESALVEWEYQHISKAVDEGAEEYLSNLYETYAERWIRLGEYFRQLKRRVPGCVFEAHVERGADEASNICEFLQIDIDSFQRGRPEGSVNPSGISHALQDVRIKALFDALWERKAQKFSDLAEYHGYQL